MQHEQDMSLTLPSGIQVEIYVKYTKYDGKAIDLTVEQVLPDGSLNEVFPDMDAIAHDIEASNQFADA